METTETYLNLNSEQFNSWVHEFENKYNKIEKNLLSEEKKEDESDSEVSIESIKSEESLKNEESDIFIKKQISEEPTFESQTNSSTNRRRFLGRKTIIRNSSETNSTTEKKTLTQSETITKSPAPKVKNDKTDNNKLVKPYQEKILSIKELNSVLPNLKKNNNQIDANIKENIEQKDESKKMGEVALYKFIAKRRR